MPLTVSPDSRLAVYDLIEAAQDEEHDGVREKLADIAGRAELDGLSDLAQLAISGVVLYDMYHSEDAAQVALDCADLVHRADALGLPGARAIALALRAQFASSTADGEGMLADAGLAVALVERDEAPAYDRCLVWTTVGCAYAFTNLWELADEMFDRADELAPECEDPNKVLAPVNVDRVLVRLAWAGALLEHDDESDARRHLAGARDAAEVAILTAGLPQLWRREVVAVRDLMDFLQLSFSGADVVEADLLSGRLLEQAAGLRGVGSEVMPYLGPYLALGLLRLGRRDAAKVLLDEGFEHTHTSGSQSFQAWVRAQVLAADVEGEAVLALKDYAAVICDLRWSARAGVLAAARARIDEARLTAEHAVLTREVMRDALTGLENRRRFERWLSDDAQPDRPVALVLIDVDEFKQVNDVYGHAVGDEALRRIAIAITDGIRGDDVALRIGGDEFAIIMSASDELMERDDADRVLHRAARNRAQEMSAAVAATPWDQVGPGLRVTISVGLATQWLGEHHAGTAERAYRLADEDLYATKYRGTRRSTG